jgi:hypothetical protein
MHLRFIFSLLAMVIVQVGVAQSQSIPNSLHPPSTSPKSELKPAKKKNRFFSPHRAKTSRIRRTPVRHTARYEFYERVEKAAKERQRLLRKLAKPAYSDPRYFGHKRIPKRRPPHRMRYCDECSIRH